MNDCSEVIPYRLRGRGGLKSEPRVKRGKNSHARDEDRDEQPAHDLLGGVFGAEVNRESCGRFSCAHGGEEEEEDGKSGRRAGIPLFDSCDLVGSSNSDVLSSIGQDTTPQKACPRFRATPRPGIPLPMMVGETI